MIYFSEKYKEWLKTLKVGDEIAIASCGYSSTYYTLTTVLKVTPGGKIRIENGDLFSSNGTRTENVYHKYMLVPVDSTVKDYFVRLNLVGFYVHFDMDNYTTESLIEAKKILEEGLKDESKTSSSKDREDKSS